jgi:hypothetical protein
MSPSFREDGDTATLSVGWDAGPAEVSWSVNNARTPVLFLGEGFTKTIPVKPGDVVRVDGKLSDPKGEIDCTIVRKGVSHKDQGNGRCTMTVTIT